MCYRANRGIDQLTGAHLCSAWSGGLGNGEGSSSREVTIQVVIYVCTSRRWQIDTINWVSVLEKLKTAAQNRWSEPNCNPKMFVKMLRRLRSQPLFGIMNDGVYKWNTKSKNCGRLSPCHCMSYFGTRWEVNQIMNIFIAYRDVTALASLRTKLAWSSAKCRCLRRLRVK